MDKRVSFSGQEQSLEEIAVHYSTVEAAIFEFFSGSAPATLGLYLHSQVAEARTACLSELDFSSAMSVMSSVEAAVRKDYLTRVYNRWKDPLSRSMRDLHREKRDRAGLERDLLPQWGTTTSIAGRLLSEVMQAFRYRHWLAHGRYWEPKFGRTYDYITVYGLAEEFIDAMDEYDDR
jgi:hypothetical protein